MTTWWAAALGTHSDRHHSNHCLEKIFLSGRAPAVERKQRPVDKEHLAINRESLHSLLDCGAVETPNTSYKTKYTHEVGCPGATLHKRGGSQGLPGVSACPAILRCLGTTQPRPRRRCGKKSKNKIEKKTRRGTGWTCWRSSRLPPQ